MKTIAPHITRQRLLIEGFYTVSVDETVINNYFNSLAAELKLRTYGEAIIFSPAGEGKEENQGYDAFIPLIDSGISGYFWTKESLFSIIIYTCKSFDAKAAIKFTTQFFAAHEVPEHMEF